MTTTVMTATEGTTGATTSGVGTAGAADGTGTGATTRPSHDDSRPLPITGRGLWHVGGDINVRYALVAAAGAVVGALALGAYVLWRMIPSWLSSD